MSSPLPISVVIVARNEAHNLPRCLASVNGWVAEIVVVLNATTDDSEAIANAAVDPRLFWGVAVRLGLHGLLSVPFWHAPALVHWGGQGVAQALFSSTLALWRNKAAFLVNMLLWTGLVMGVGSAVTLVFTLVGLATVAPVVLMATGLMLSTVFYASLYFSFVDCFMFGAPQSVVDQTT